MYVAFDETYFEVKNKLMATCFPDFSVQIYFLCLDNFWPLRFRQRRGFVTRSGTFRLRKSGITTIKLILQ